MAEKLCELRKKGGGGGKYTETSLWTNSSPTTSQGVTTISLTDGDMSDYKYIKLVYRYSTANSTSYNLIVPYTEFVKCVSGNSDNAVAVCMTTGSNNHYYRYIWYSNDTTVITSHCLKYNSTTQADTNAILTEILGLNELKYKPDDYIVTSGTFSVASLNTSVSVNVGFKPKKLTAWRVNASNTFESFTYDDSISTTTYVRLQVISGSNISGGTRNIGNSSTNDLISINNDGFTMATGVTTGTWNYIATGQAE